MKKYRIFTILALACVILAGCTGAYDSQRKLLQTKDKFTKSTSNSSLSDLTYKGELEKFDGTETLWQIESSGKEELAVDYSLITQKGRMKLILVNQAAGEVDVIGEATNRQKSSGQVKHPLKKGKYAVKLVGDKGKCTVNIQLMANSKLKIRPSDQLEEALKDLDDL